MHTNQAPGHRTVQRRKPRTANIGLFGVGHSTYWPQFEGLLDELMGHHRVLAGRIAAQGVSVTDLGMVDDALAAYDAVKKLKAGNFDLIFCNMLTYATSSTWGIIARELDVPIVLVALQPLRAMDYEQATTRMQLANDNICSVPEFAGVSVRMR